MKKKIWLAISALTILSAGANATSFDSLGKNYNRSSVTLGSNVTPSYQGTEKKSSSSWAPNVNLDNANGAPKIALDNAYGSIKNTSGVSSDIKSQINKNAYEWVPNGTIYKRGKRNHPPYSSLDTTMLGVRCNTPGTMRITSTETHQTRHSHHHGHGDHSTYSYTTTGYTYTLAKCK